MKNDNFASAPSPAGIESGYARCRVEEVFNVPFDGFLEWFVHEPVENFLLGTMIVPAISGTEALAGPAWGMPGSARKIFFKDGSTSLERIVETDFPSSYTYQPWAYTNPVRFLSDYALATASVVNEKNQTRFVWDYGFHARNGLALPLLRAFVRLDWKRNMANGLAVLKKRIEVHGIKHRIHEMQDKLLTKGT